MVGSFNADFYLIGGLFLESRKRREHLSSEDLQKNKAIIENLTRGSSAMTGSDGVIQGQEPQRRKSLQPPQKIKIISWNDYINCSPGKHSPLGRDFIFKESVKAFRATLAMVILNHHF